MQKQLLFHLLTYFFTMFSLSVLWGQSQIQGVVIDAETKETLVGVQIQIENIDLIAFTDIEGRFSLSSPVAPPFVIKAHFFGYDSLEYVLLNVDTEVKLSLSPTPYVEEITKVSGKRAEAFLLNTPDPVKKLDFMDIMMNPLPDFYTGLVALEGVQTYYASVGLVAINTRGFANVFNNRVTQLVDGVDVSIPGYNVPISNSIGPSELDIIEAELLAGPGSALYSANAFNGILQIKTRNIEDYPGISAYIKQGVTQQEDIGTRPFTDLGLRYAFEKGNFGAKFTVSYLHAKEWFASDYENLLGRPTQPSSPLELFDNDIRNIYGDLSLISLPDNSFINRTGFREEDIFDENVNNIRTSALLRYKVGENLSFIYENRLSQIDYIDRTGFPTPVENELTILQRLEVRGRDFFVRTYLTDIVSGESFNPEIVGGEIQASLLPNEEWGERYLSAWTGNIEGINANDPIASRAYADLFVPEVDEAVIDRLREDALVNPNGSPSSLNQRNRSSLWHVEGQYNLIPGIFSSNTKTSLQVGGSYRKYNLKSDGTLFNDGPESMFSNGITIWEAGAYIMMSQKLLDEKLILYGSVRLDEHQDFRARISPRLASTYQLDPSGKHFVRLQIKSGFRTPVPSEMFALEGGNSLTNPLFLGSRSRNLRAFQANNVNGEQIFANLVTLESFNAFLSDGNFNPEIFERTNFQLLEQEQVRSLELGYRGLIQNNFFIDVNAYVSEFENFSVSSLAFSPELFSPVITTNNFGEDIIGWGAGFKLEYLLARSYKIQSSYSYSDVNIETSFSEASVAERSVPSFNASKHLINLAISNRNVFRGLGFTFQYRWWSSYTWNWTAVFHEIPATGLVDIALTAKIPDKPVLLKLGSSNVFNKEIFSGFIGPSIGSQYYVSITFDKFFW